MIRFLPSSRLRVTRRQSLETGLVIAAGLAGCSMAPAGSSDVVPNIAALAEAEAPREDGSSVTVLGFRVPGDHGGGTFRWNAASTAAPITGMIVPARQGESGRWFREHGGEINDRMCGAAIDGVSFDDAALTALAAMVESNRDVRVVRFLPGVRRILPPGGPEATPFHVVECHGLTIHWDGATFMCRRKTAENPVTAFRFVNCHDLKGVGVVRFTGTLTREDILEHTSARGSIGLMFAGACNNADVSVFAEGMLEAVLFSRAPRVSLDPTIAPFIGDGGSGYSVGDILTLHDIGSVATLPAKMKVTGTRNGTVVALQVIQPGLFPNFFDGDIAGSTKGFRVSGGGGRGCLVCPYTIDRDDSGAAAMSRGGSIRVAVRTCFYGYNGQWNLSDADIEVDADIVYRAYFAYGVTENRVRISVRNQHLNSVIACVMGVPTSASFAISVLPATIPGFCNAGTVLVVGFYGANSGRMKVDVAFNASRVGGTDCGQYLKIDKYAEGLDDANPRGHRLELSIGGTIDGHGVHDSGLGRNIIGTNINYSDRSWLGDEINISLRDGFRVTHSNGWNIVLNVDALASLTVGMVDLDCGILLVQSGKGGSPTLASATTAQIRISDKAQFANRKRLVKMIS